VSYKTDLNQALAIVREIVESHSHVLKEPQAAVGVSRLGQPAITIAVEPWTKVVHYGSLQGELSKAIVERFRAAQIEFPSAPQVVPAR
jgi:small-conductance mechanosensitive channel